MKPLFWAASLSLFLACTLMEPLPDPRTIIYPADSVTPNPWGAAPLCALIKYSSLIPLQTRIIVKSKYRKGPDIEARFDDLGFSHSVPVMGLYANYTNTVEVIMVDTNGNDYARHMFEIRTGPLPANLPTSIAVTAGDPENMENGFYLVSNLSTDNPNIPLMIDRFGEIRWLLDYTAKPPLNELLYDGGVIKLANGNFCFGNIKSGAIYEVDLLGKALKAWTFPGYTFHHAVQEKPDGNLLVTMTKSGSTRDGGRPTIEDYVIELDRNTGAIRNEWDLKSSLDEYRAALGNSSNAMDWFHGNDVIFDSSDNTIIVSGRLQGVVKLTYDNRVKWILAPHRGWDVNKNGVDLNRFLLTPIGGNGNIIADTNVADGRIDHPDFEWCWFQHSPVIMPDGDLLLFDNGSIRNFNFLDTVNLYSRAVEYRIDPVAMTVRQIWSYGKNRGKAAYSRIISNVQYFPSTRHVLFCPGYQVSNANGSGGKIIEIDYDTKNVVFEMEISTETRVAFHKVSKVDLYPFQFVVRQKN